MRRDIAFELLSQHIRYSVVLAQSFGFLEEILGYLAVAAEQFLMYDPVFFGLLATVLDGELC